jgi:3-deoxy-D-manno-octulosonate 8-phosphate phosphatase (KDO 8-P phosphatase)
MTLTDRAARVRLLLLDVDGVLTDGTVVVHSDGSESKVFSIRDGAALVWAQRAGLTVGLLSARRSGATAQRAAQLAIRHVYQGVTSKRETYERILRDTGMTDEAVGYMGDDLVDLAVFARAGFAAAPADAAPEVIARAHWVSGAVAGRGAVRELVELVLKAQHKWDPIVADYAAGASLAREN